jgi:hypothetical protein
MRAGKRSARRPLLLPRHNGGNHARPTAESRSRKLGSGRCGRSVFRNQDTISRKKSTRAHNARMKSSP